MSYTPIIFIMLEDLERVKEELEEEELPKTIRNEFPSEINMFGKKVAMFRTEFSDEAYELCDFCIKNNIRWRADYYSNEYYKVMAEGTLEEKKKFLENQLKEKKKELNKQLKELRKKLKSLRIEEEEILSKIKQIEEQEVDTK